jgi:hypothetical protein
MRVFPCARALRVDTAHHARFFMPRPHLNLEHVLPIVLQFRDGFLDVG